MATANPLATLPIPPQRNILAPHIPPAKRAGPMPPGGRQKAPPMNDKSPARSRADILSASQARDKLVKSEIAKERASLDAKTARLRALRLERDAALSAQQPQAGAEPPAKIRRSRAKKPAA